MPVDETLARAWAELADGQVGRARQRLHGLLASYPTRLDVRAALAATHRAERDRVQAGRWSFLGPDRDPEELAAFLAAYPGPLARMRAMRWAGPEDAAGPEAQARLVDLRRAAEQHTGGPVTWRTDRPRPGPHPTRAKDALAMGGCFLVVAVLAALTVIGAVTVVRWIW